VLLRQHTPAGVTLCFSRETELLGTGGGIRAAWGLLDPTQPLIVMNGDILFRPDLAAAMAIHRERGALATMVVRDHPQAHRLGAVETDAAGRVVRLLGLPHENAAVRAFMFTGVHVLSPETFEELPETGCIIRDFYRRWVDAARPVYAVSSEACFRDIGTHAEYLAAHLDALEGPLSVSPIHPEARVGEGAVVTRCWVGARASVAPGVRLDGCVVWPDTDVTVSASLAIIGPFGVVRED
jgi:NDP-sugar pyrophosphorylase family protein